MCKAQIAKEETKAVAVAAAITDLSIQEKAYDLDELEVFEKAIFCFAPSKY